MKEIKLRAWLKKERKMVDVGTLTFGFHPDWIEYYRETFFIGGEQVTEGETCEILEPDYILMLYTGKKDDNGKEICVGDILGTPHPVNKNIDASGWKEAVKFGEYDNGEYYGDNVSGIGFYTEDEEGVIRSLLHPLNKTIIGNIFENPELLEN